MVIRMLRWFYAKESGLALICGHVNRCKIVLGVFVTSNARPTAELIAGNTATIPDHFTHKRRAVENWESQCSKHSAGKGQQLRIRQEINAQFGGYIFGEMV